MELSTAILLIKDGVGAGAPQAWADLGAGRGLFTNALSTLLASGSIVALDKDEGALKSIRSDNPSVSLELQRGDLLKAEFSSESLDGILMANSLHYVRDKIGWLRRLGPSLKKSGRIIVVEYDMDTSNPYVPYPVSFSSLGKISKSAGFASCVKLSTVASVYQSAGMYSALLKL